jgi:hypothetical protein
MSGHHHPVRILVIQLWTVDAQPIARALTEAGIDASIVRADFEAALNAALAHERFDVAMFDPSTPDLTRETVEHCLQLNGRETPLVVLGDLATLCEQLHRVLATRRN